MKKKFSFNPTTGKLDQVINDKFIFTTSNITCTASEDVGDAVYMFSNNAVRKTDASNISTSKVVGFIVSKPTSTSCVIQYAGNTDLFTGMNVGDNFFLSETPGDISNTPPSTSGSVIVNVGTALSGDDFNINLSNNYTIRS